MSTHTLWILLASVAFAVIVAAGLILRPYESDSVVPAQRAPTCSERGGAIITDVYNIRRCVMVIK